MTDSVRAGASLTGPLSVARKDAAAAFARWKGLKALRNSGAEGMVMVAKGGPERNVPRDLVMHSKKLILVVEERFELARHAFELLTLHGFEVELACTSWRGSEMARLRRPDLIVVTLNIDEGHSAEEAAGALGALHIPTVVPCGFGGRLARQMVEALQPSAVLWNPVSDADLLAAVAAALPEHPRRAAARLAPFYEHG